MKKHIRCVIVDDEPPAIRVLENYIKQIPNLELVFATTKPLEIIPFMEKEPFDVIIMDIQMPNITGIQLSKILKSDVKIIFTTAYSEFAVESYNLNAIDYILKPFEFERFYNAIKKVNNETSTAIKRDKDYVFIKTDSKNNFEKVLIDDIVYIEGLKNYVAIHTQNRKQIITYNTLKSILDSLPKSQFIQIHKSYIVSVSMIHKTNTSSVTVNKNVELPIGSTYKTAFFETISKYKL